VRVVTPETHWEALNARIPPFNNVLARRAVNYAVDRRRMDATNSLTSGPTCQLLPPNFSAYVAYCPYTRPGPRLYNGPDLATAQRLVDASGTRGMHVTLYGIVGIVGTAAYRRYLAAVLRTLHYRVTVLARPLNLQNWDYAYDSRSRLQVPGATGWAADWPSPGNFYDVFSCATFKPANGKDFNMSEFCDPALDRLAASAQNLSTLDPGASRRAWTQLDHRLTDAAPFIHASQVWFISSRVKNFAADPATSSTLMSQTWVH
jgi:peptide/nickel transport system substrate-binding protein